MFLASSLIVEMKSNPIIAKNRIVDPVKVPLQPRSTVTKGYIFEVSNLVKAIMIMNIRVRSLTVVSVVLKFDDF